MDVQFAISSVFEDGKEKVSVKIEAEKVSALTPLKDMSRGWKDEIPGSSPSKVMLFQLGRSLPCTDILRSVTTSITVFSTRHIMSSVFNQLHPCVQHKSTSSNIPSSYGQRLLVAHETGFMFLEGNTGKMLRQQSLSFEVDSGKRGTDKQSPGRTKRIC